MKEGAGVGLVFISPLGVPTEYLVRLHFLASNNIAEYEALINSLRIEVELRTRRLEIRGDSKLVVDQVMMEKNCVDPKMAAYCQAVRELEGKFHGLELHLVLRDYNKVVDVLAKTASSRKLVPHGVFASDQHMPSVRAEGEKPPEAEGPEVMETTSHLSRTSRTRIGVFLSSSVLSVGSFPSTRWRHATSRDELKHSSSSMANSRNEAQQAYLYGASSEIKAGATL
jgi:ribonuclease HI